MASPFPGMDPYLEDPEIWSGVDALFLGEIITQLYRRLRPKYVIRYEERVYLADEDDPVRQTRYPDVKVFTEAQRPQRVGSQSPAATMAGGTAIDEPIPVTLIDEPEVHEKYLHVLDVKSHDVVTVIELLSPANKTKGSGGRKSFMDKRREVFASDAHWIEIDLLRAGVRTIVLPGIPASDYLIYLSRAGDPRRDYAWPAWLRHRLPTIAVPLRDDDADAPLNLQAVLAETIDKGSYDTDFDYTSPPPVPLKPEDAAWAAGVASKCAHNDE